MNTLPVSINTLPIIAEVDADKKPSPSMTRRVQVAAKTIFDEVIAIVEFPLRYIGSKTWSIPGVILRIPYVLFKRLFVTCDRSIFEELFPTHYHYSFEKTLEREELRPYYPHVCGTAFVHQTKEEYIPTGWHYLSPAQLGIQMPGVETKDKELFDPATMFLASFIEKDNEIIVSFGSLGVKRPGNDHPPQESRVAQLVVGITPKTLRQGDALVKQLLEHPYFEGKKICLTGNSYGGTIAAYAALKNDVEAVCFNSLPLGVGPQYDVGEERLRHAAKHITYISVAGDVTTDRKIFRVIDCILGTIGIRTMGNFGRQFRIPAAYTKAEEIHGFTLGSVMKHLGYDIRTIPNQLPAF